MEARIVPKNKKGGVVTTTVMGVGGLLIAVVIILVVVSTILNANLLPIENDTGEGFNSTAEALSGNFTVGINNISAKIPTILLIVAVVFLFGALVLLIRNANLMGVGGSGSL